MQSELFQLVLLVSNALFGLAFWSLRQEVKHVKEILTLQIAANELRLQKVESKCLDCPSQH